MINSVKDFRGKIEPPVEKGVLKIERYAQRLTQGYSAYGGSYLWAPGFDNTPIASSLQTNKKMLCKQKREPLQVKNKRCKPKKKTGKKRRGAAEGWCPLQ